MLSQRQKSLLKSLIMPFLTLVQKCLVLSLFWEFLFCNHCLCRNNPLTTGIFRTKFTIYQTEKNFRFVAKLLAMEFFQNFPRNQHKTMHKKHTLLKKKKISSKAYVFIINAFTLIGKLTYF